MHHRSEIIMSMKFTKIILIITFITLTIACSSGSDDVTLGPTSTPTPATNTPTSGTPVPTTAPGNEKVWTIDQVLSEPAGNGSGQDISCGGEFGFKRCNCAYDVPPSLRYRPALSECNGNAAAIMSQELIDIFSVVVRDSQNKDRWPEAGSGFGGCSFELANSDAPPNRCSAFKVQDSFEVANGAARVYCFGASGYSDIFADAVRLTVKITDSPSSNDDEIERYCLVAGDKPLN